MLFNEPKLLKFWIAHPFWRSRLSFSALQRAEIAEMVCLSQQSTRTRPSFSALQRAEIAEIIYPLQSDAAATARFSALQRAEIAEIYEDATVFAALDPVSVLFNEPKLLKSLRSSL